MNEVSITINGVRYDANRYAQMFQEIRQKV